MISNREGREWLLSYLYDKGLKYIVWDSNIGRYFGVNKVPRKYNDGKWDYSDVTRYKINLIFDLFPSFNEPNYLDVGKYLGITDWSKVATDTPVYAKLYDGGIWYPLHFAKYENGDAYVYTGGRTSWSKDVKDAVCNTVAKAYEIRLAEGGAP